MITTETNNEKHRLGSSVVEREIADLGVAGSTPAQDSHVENKAVQSSTHTRGPVAKELLRPPNKRKIAGANPVRP